MKLIGHSLAVLLLWGCSDPLATGLRVTVEFGVAVDQLRVQTLVDNKLDAEKTIPPTADKSLKSGIRVLLLLGDDLDGKKVVVKIKGFNQDAQVAHGQNETIVNKGQVGELVVKLVAGCQSECTDGEKQCVKNQFRVCKEQTAGCGTWQPLQDCPQETPFCESGVCKGECSDKCQQGQKRCTSDNKGYETCGNHDSDSCLEWGSPQSCGTKTCSGAGKKMKYTALCPP